MKKVMPNFKKLSQYWNNYTYPWRPGKEVLNIISQHLHVNQKVCILGSTTEFRKLCKDIGCQVDIYDTSKDMFKTGDVGNSNELYYHIDWFDIQNKKYDLILGDLISFLFNKDEQKKLLNILKKNLSKTGIIILRTGSKKGGNIEKLYSLIEHTENGGISFLNYICFEYVIGYHGKTGEISTILENYNPILFSLFKNTLINLVPYGDGEIFEDCLGNLGTEIYSKDFILSKEKLVSF